MPEANIHCLNYLWLHPNMRLMSGGAWCWQGFKGRQLEAELFDMRDFIPDAAITDEGGDIDDVTLPNGYRHEVITPLEEVRVSYEDSARGNAFEVTMKAIMSPAMLPSGKHFDQAMKTEGWVTLGGTRHEVDGYTVRDRSWAEARTEDPMAVSPMSGSRCASTTTSRFTSPGSRTRAPRTGATASTPTSPSPAR